jgi:hypothetical protein
MAVTTEAAGTNPALALEAVLGGAFRVGIEAAGGIRLGAVVGSGW